MLSVSGELDPAMGGPSVAATEPRRSIYAKVMRNTREPLLDAFDAPDGSNTTPTRNVTITPTQSLMLINGAWTIDRARAFAGRLQRFQSLDLSGRIDLAYRLALGRRPDALEHGPGGSVPIGPDPDGGRAGRDSFDPRRYRWGCDRLR